MRTPARLRFEGADRAVLDHAGHNETLAVEERLDAAVDLIRRLNGLRLADGSPLRAHAGVAGFEPWWFSQEYLFWGLLAPFVRYRPMLEALAGLTAVEVEDAPADFRKVASLLADHQVLPPCRWPDAPAPAPRGGGGARLLAASVMAWLRFVVRRPRVLLYAIDKVSPGLRHDFRLDAVYRELARRGLSFAEYVHLTDTALAVRQLGQRGRPVVFHEVVAAALARFGPRHSPAPAVEAPEAAALERAMLTAAARIGAEMAEASAFRFRVLRGLLATHRPAYALVLDDSRYANELVAACKALGVPVVGYQHGLTLNRYFAGHACYGWAGARSHAADRYGLWSPYFQRRVLEFSELHDAESTFVCGNLRPPTAAPAEAPARPAGAPIRVLLISEPKARPDEVAPVLDRLLGDPGFAVSLKLRPGEDLGPIRGVLGDRLERVAHLAPPTVYEAFAEADVVMGMYSSVLYEAILADKPVVLLASSSPYALEDLPAHGLAERIDAPDQAADAVRRAAALAPEALRERRVVVWGDQEATGAAALIDAAEALSKGARHG